MGSDDVPCLFFLLLSSWASAVLYGGTYAGGQSNHMGCLTQDASDEALWLVSTGRQVTRDRGSPIPPVLCAGCLNPSGPAITIVFTVSVGGLAGFRCPD